MPDQKKPASEKPESRPFTSRLGTIYQEGVLTERERCAKVARETALGNHDSWDAACNWIAYKIEGGE